MMNKLRRIVRLGLSTAIYYSGLLAVYSFLRRMVIPEANLTILLYHRILDDVDKKKADTQPGMCVTQHNFEEQMKFLSKHYNLLSLEELVKIIENSMPIPPKTAVITFDDGWRDNYQYAFPVMKKCKVPATIFLTTDLMETNRLPAYIEVSLLLAEGDLWPQKAVRIFQNVVHENKLLQSVKDLDEHRLDLINKDASVFVVTFMLLDLKYMKYIRDEMKKESGLDIEEWDNNRWMLNWDEILEMGRYDIDFGSHGKSHKILTYLSHNQVRQELIQSKVLIEKKTGKSVFFFAYPNHDFDAQIKKMVQEAGYCGAGSGLRRDKNEERLDLFALKRINVNEGATVGPAGDFSRAVFACYLERIFKI